MLEAVSPPTVPPPSTPAGPDHPAVGMLGRTVGLGVKIAPEFGQGADQFQVSLGIRAPEKRRREIEDIRQNRLASLNPGLLGKSLGRAPVASPR